MNITGQPKRQCYVSPLPPDGESHAGTIEDPYRGGTPAEFESLFRDIIPEGDMIHLLEGRFETYGFRGMDGTPQGVYVKNGWQILGAGKDRTVLVLVDANNGKNCVLKTHPAHEDVNADILIQGLTIDCNAPALGMNVGLSGVQVGGVRNLTLMDVDVRNAIGKRQVGDAYEEEFIILLGMGSSQFPGGEDYLISACNVFDFQGGYASGISFQGVGPYSGVIVIELCEVVMSHDPDEPGSSQIAFNVTGANGVWVLDNRCSGAQVGFHCDTSTSSKRCLFIRRNEFNVTTAQSFGVAFLWPEHSAIQENTIRLSAGCCTAIRVLYHRPTEPKARHIQVANNTILTEGTPESVYGLHFESLYLSCYLGPVDPDFASGDHIEVIGNELSHGLQNLVENLRNDTAIDPAVGRFAASQYIDGGTVPGLEDLGTYVWSATDCPTLPRRRQSRPDGLQTPRKPRSSSRARLRRSDRCPFRPDRRTHLWHTGLSLDLRKHWRT
jgi:hypothetical protein